MPRWDFNWQNVYFFKEPIKLPKGSRLYAVANWDNSSNNPYNPDPSKRVRFGLQTWDEMMVGWVAYVWERPEEGAELARKQPTEADLLFDRLDRNGDDVLTPDELPEQMKPLLAAGGVQLPEKMTREEFTKLYNEFRKRFQRKPAPQPQKKAEEKP